jgi:hypothetical protein
MSGIDLIFILQIFLSCGFCVLCGIDIGLHMRPRRDDKPTKPTAPPNQEDAK